MLDSRSFIYLPRWVRITAISFLAAAVVFGAGFSWYLAVSGAEAGRDHSNLIAIGMSLVQTGLSALAIAWILIYSERDLGTEALQQRTEDFLVTQLPRVFRRVTPSYDLRATSTEVAVLGRTDIFGAGYRLENGTDRLMLWVGLNVSRLIVIYWIAAKDGMDAKRAAEVFRYTFGGAAKVGFDVFYEQARTPGGEDIVSIWATAKANENLLTLPAERLFWMQDVAMMTESFWRTAKRYGVAPTLAEPSPL